MDIMALKVRGGNVFNAINCFIQQRFARATDAIHLADIAEVVTQNDSVFAHRDDNSVASPGGF